MPAPAMPTVTRLTAATISTLCGTGLATAAAVFVAVPQTATAQSLCSQYTVVRGDMLSRIASEAEVTGGFQALFNANRDVLSSPNLIEVGQVLNIPCADGSLPDAAQAAVVPASTAPAPEITRPLRVVTASDYAPFTDTDLPGGGFFTQLVLRAFELGNPEQDIQFFFVNDWNAQLDSLLPYQAVDMAFPWFRPDCDRVELLSEPNAYRCTQFNHSDPFYDALIGYYTFTGSPYENAASYDDLLGARICRPDAWFTFDMEAEGLVEPAVTMVRAPSQVDCWREMLAGNVDVVTYDALPAEDDARSNGLMDRVVTLDALATTATLHVFVDKENAEANAALPIINAGLEELRMTGEWFTIVRAAIQETVEN